MNSRKKPIVQLVNFAETIGQGKYDATLKINRWANREIVTLLGSFNEMAGNILETSQKMEAAQKASKTLLQKIIHAQEEERARVSRELHDETNQCLAAINLGLDRMYEEEEVAKSKQLSKELQKIVMQASTDLKRLAWELRPSAIDKVGLTLAIQNYVDTFTKNYHINVSCTCELADDDVLDGETSIVVYRIIQEALTNIVKHAKADQVEIILTKAPERLMVIIEDNGKGFDAANVLDLEKRSSGKHTTLGLYGMMERAELMEGIW
ncbi:HAMP domain-containing sensor histidine kinase [Desulfosporosinus nitroreducens]|uniref:HAMP domain-containing sensor histidine kinase n=1 Tax=Desulfosporosinus nitroreducens TaxID=2018668 RepID=UPI00207C22CC|nr:ATP-binding protein [Desulfosporosinus nitroreducens]MCO1600205.1 histidine kinase [Desulfosporosinus nitroreducens]